MENRDSTPFSVIEKYFAGTESEKLDKLRLMYPLYKEWNSKINVISRKDIEMLYLHHVLHSLAIARYIEFRKNERILDVGTGGGFPGLPLAILYPECSFTLVDSIGKKIKVVEEIASALELKNVTAIKARAEETKGNFHYIISRAVTELKNFYPWVKGRYSKGILYLKGGDITDNKDIAQKGTLLCEIEDAVRECGIKRELVTIANISDIFTEEFFLQKRIIHIHKS